MLLTSSVVWPVWPRLELQWTDHLRHAAGTLLETLGLTGTQILPQDAVDAVLTDDTRQAEEHVLVYSVQPLQQYSHLK